MPVAHFYLDMNFLNYSRQKSSYLYDILASPAAGLKAGCLVVPLSEQAARKKEQIWEESEFCLVGTESEALSSQSG